MSKREEIEERASLLLTPILEKKGYELVDVEYVKEAGTWYLRGYIDKPGGITIGDLEAVSREFSDLLDVGDFIEEAYVLEVSSPGLDRPLKKPKDYERSLGKLVEIRTYKPTYSQKEFVGTLKSYTDTTVTIESEEGQLLDFEKKEIALIRLAVIF